MPLILAIRFRSWSGKEGFDFSLLKINCMYIDFIIAGHPDINQALAAVAKSFHDYFADNPKVEVQQVQTLQNFIPSKMLGGEAQMTFLAIMTIMSDSKIVYKNQKQIMKSV